MIPTIEEYQNALKIVSDYESEQLRLYYIQEDLFKRDLQIYFDNNKIDNDFYLKEFVLRNEHPLNPNVYGDIIPINPCMEENYEGSNNDDIEKICKKHKVNFKIIYWCYPK